MARIDLLMGMVTSRSLLTCLHLLCRIMVLHLELYFHLYFLEFKL